MLLSNYLLVNINDNIIYGYNMVTIWLQYGYNMLIVIEWLIVLVFHWINYSIIPNMKRVLGYFHID